MRKDCCAQKVQCCTAKDRAAGTPLDCFYSPGDAKKRKCPRKTTGDTGSCKQKSVSLSRCNGRLRTVFKQTGDRFKAPLGARSWQMAHGSGDGWRGLRQAVGTRAERVSPAAGQRT